MHFTYYETLFLQGKATSANSQSELNSENTETVAEMPPKKVAPVTSDSDDEFGKLIYKKIYCSWSNNVSNNLTL